MGVEVDLSFTALVKVKMADEEVWEMVTLV